MTSPSEATTSEVLCTLLYHYCILWGMGRRGTGVTIRPALPRFVLSPLSLLQQATKSQSWSKGKQHQIFLSANLFYLSHVFGFAKEMISCRHPVQTFFSRCSKMTVTMSIIYLSPHKWWGCGGEGACWAKPPPDTRWSLSAGWPGPDKQVAKQTVKTERKRGEQQWWKTLTMECSDCATLRFYFWGCEPPSASLTMTLFPAVLLPVH